MRRDPTGRPLHGNEVRVSGGSGRGADAEEDDLRRLDRLGGVDGEPKAARTRSAFDEFGEPRLEERRGAALEPADPLFVLVDTDDVVLERRQGCRSWQPNVTDSDDDDPH